MKTLTLGILRDVWMMHEPSVDAYAMMAIQYLAGKEISTGFFSSLKIPDVPENVALIVVAGAITKSDVCGWTGSRSLTMQLNEAANDKQKEAIILLFECCPGGQVAGTKDFADAVSAAKTKKPVVAAVSELCASAGVWIGSQATEMYATSETDLIGCIGVMGRIKNPAKQEAGQQDYIEVVSDFSPDKNSEFKSADAHKEAILNPMAKIFQDAVVSGRGDKLKLEKENVLSGKTYIAAKAKAAGLIDGIMPFEKIVKRSLNLAKTIK